MCYRTEISADIKIIAKRFGANYLENHHYLQSEEVNGFEYLKTPIIIDEDPLLIQSEFHWGLIPKWSKDVTIRKNTLNAKIETLEEKPAFSHSINRRCLIIATAFYEWRWEDEKGKRKQKFKIYSAESEIFCFAGIYSTWKNPNNTDEILKTYSILTTQANEQMCYIHNMRRRMPVVLNQESESQWLDSNNPPEAFSFPNYQPKIVAFTI